MPFYPAALLAPSFARRVDQEVMFDRVSILPNCRCAKSVTPRTQKEDTKEGSTMPNSRSARSVAPKMQRSTKEEKVTTNKQLLRSACHSVDQTKMHTEATKAKNLVCVHMLQLGFPFEALFLYLQHTICQQCSILSYKL